MPVKEYNDNVQIRHTSVWYICPEVDHCKHLLHSSCERVHAHRHDALVIEDEREYKSIGCPPCVLCDEDGNKLVTTLDIAMLMKNMRGLNKEESKRYKEYFQSLLTPLDILK